MYLGHKLWPKINKSWKTILNKVVIFVIYRDEDSQEI